MARDNGVWDIVSVYVVQSVLLPGEMCSFLIRMFNAHRLRVTNGVGKHLKRTCPTAY